MPRRFLTLVLLCMSTVGAADDPFVTDVAPILAARCLSCHNDEERKGEFSFSQPSNVLDPQWVTPGRPEESYLLELITPVNGVAEMPAESDPLSPKQIETIRKWLASGADIPQGYQIQSVPLADLNWWSLEPISPIVVPEDVHPVDWFLDRRLDEQNLKPLPLADPITLVRRVYFDLTGLPPTPNQVDSFVQNDADSPDTAWAALVDTLLAAPEFGEKFGQHWLDIARYAETHGYDKDKPRSHAWPYRDYVIAAFNQDLPYSQFVREQIAGDVLADDRSRGIVATGFLAAGPWDLIAHTEVGEEKIDGRIAKHLDRDEMASAVFNVFQSTTIQCAQCHNHKFDPISSEDYYRVHAVFAAVDRADRVYAGLSREQQSQQTTLRKQREELIGMRDELQKKLDAEIHSQADGVIKRIAALERKADSTAPPQHGFHSQISADQHTTKWVQVDLGQSKMLKHLEWMACFDNFNSIGEGFGFPVRFKVEVSSDDAFSETSRRILFESLETDFENPLSRPLKIASDGKPVRFIRLTATKLAHRKNDYILALGELLAVDAESGTNVARGAAVTASDAIPDNARWALKHLVDERFYAQSLPDEEMDELIRLRKRRDQIVAAKQTPEIRSRLEDWQRQIGELDKQLASFPKGQLVYGAATEFDKIGRFSPSGGNMRPIHFLHRGDIRAPGERMLPGAPKLWSSARSQFFLDNDFGEAQARVALANYVTAPDNPLLFRSMANRVWQWTFGKPIVGTPNDFGRMGMQPSHPDLLDYLAATLRDDPTQSIKSLVRLLVTSRAYRRSSGGATSRAISTANREVDASNDFYWRMQRRRLTAEEFRDSLYSVAGLLRRSDRGGKSFQDFVIERPQHSPHYEYQLHDVNDPATFRRTIYRFVVRSQPHPMLMTLDCADPSISVPQRDESTTALQALTQWNHRLVELSARHFAQRIANDPIEAGCRLAWGRPPNSDERAILARTLQRDGAESMCRILLNANAFVYIE